MDKKTKKELERLRNLTETERNLLSGVYGDLFGNPERSAGSEEDEAEGERGDISDAIGDARKALREAQDLIVRSNALTQGILESNRTGLENLPGKSEAVDTIIKNEGGDPAVIQTSPSSEDAAQTVSEQPLKQEMDPMEELDSLIGLGTIKHDVKELIAFVRIQKLRKEEGLKSVPVSLHLVFTGNPGTGKTTVARIIARLYKQIGVLSGGQLVEVDRSGLVAGYVGQTALKTQEQIAKAMGGVLFIDEAYALAQRDDAFGQEAIDTILKAMEDHREDFVVIVAGYTAPMETFMNSNPGLKSRFNKYIAFPDYTVDELEQIFYQNCEKYDYVVEEDAKHQIRAMIVSRKLQRQENFANAREIRNMFEEIITNQARRVAAIERPTHEDMMTITLYDLSEEDNTEDRDDGRTDAEENG